MLFSELVMVCSDWDMMCINNMPILYLYTCSKLEVINEYHKSDHGMFFVNFYSCLRRYAICTNENSITKHILFLEIITK